MEITSRHNPQIKRAIALQERRTREREQLFLIEGYRELLRALDAPSQKVISLFYCPELFLGENEFSLIGQWEARGAELFRCPSILFEKLSYRDRPDGLLGVGEQNHLGLRDLKGILDALPKETPPLLIAAEAIEKPGNLGSLLRSADAAGVHALLLADRVTDIHNPNVVRASVGTLFTVPVIEATSEELLNFLAEWSISLLAGTPHSSMVYTDAPMNSAIAIAVGAEQLGLSQQWLNAARQTVCIPMLGKADSLNVTVAATLLLYEAVRQRRKS